MNGQGRIGRNVVVHVGEGTTRDRGGRRLPGRVDDDIHPAADVAEQPCLDHPCQAFLLGHAAPETDRLLREGPIAAVQVDHRDVVAQQPAVQVGGGAHRLIPRLSVDIARPAVYGASINQTFV